MGLDKEQFALDDADICLYRQVVSDTESDRFLSGLINAIDWRQESVTLFGKTFPQPRLSAWHGDNSANYRYSGLCLRPEPWTPVLSELKSTVENITGFSFNSVLLNYYRDHRDCMGMHSDDEKELGKQPVIASLSLGAERVFVLKHRYRKDLKTVKVTLPSGSLLVMKGNTQSFWKHGISRQNQPSGARVNLTFRLID